MNHSTDGSPTPDPAPSEGAVDPWSVDEGDDLADVIPWTVEAVDEWDAGPAPQAPPSPWESTRPAADAPEASTSPAESPVSQEPPATADAASGDDEFDVAAEAVPGAGETGHEGEADLGVTEDAPGQTAADDDEFPPSDVPDFSVFTDEEYMKATTEEYAGLAEDVARAAAEGAEQIAVSAEIPGLESGVVGLDDVVAAAGEDAALIPARVASDLPLRVLTGLGLLVVFFGSLTRPLFIGLLVVAVLGLAAGELYLVLQRAGHHPLTLFGLAGTAGALVGTWVWGPIAIPVSLTGTLIATFVFYGVAAERSAPLHNAALTVMGAAWIGGLGAFAMDMVRADRYRWMVAAVVITTAVMDVAQYFVGRRLGRRPLAPTVSPKKTIEGLAGGVIVAIGVGLIIGLFEPFDLTRGLLIGVIVAVVAPLGDLAVSVIKRGIGVKDMGAILPGHGGVLDRVDAMIFVIPAVWVAFAWMGLV